MSGRGFLGILMLATRFPRPPGDVGHAASWPIPVRFRRVEAARRDNVVVPEALPAALVEAFAAEAEALVAQGAKAITTSCGFLVPLQGTLEARLGVPFLASALSEVAWLQEQVGPKRSVGVLTFDARILGEGHLRAAGAPVDTPMAGIEGGHELHRVISEDAPDLDMARAEADVLAAAEDLRARTPDLGGLVLECTNMGPYKRALEAASGLPVADIVSANLRRLGTLFECESG